MEGVIAHFRQNRHTTKSRHLIVVVSGVDSRDAALKLVGKKVTWKTSKRDLLGEVASAHGNKGALRVIFETGMPGQALGTKVTIA